MIPIGLVNQLLKSKLANIYLFMLTGVSSMILSNIFFSFILCIEISKEINLIISVSHLTPSNNSV